MVYLRSLLEDHLIVSLSHILSYDFRGFLKDKVIIISDVDCHSVDLICRHLHLALVLKHHLT